MVRMWQGHDQEDKPVVALVTAVVFSGDAAATVSEFNLVSIPPPTPEDAQRGEDHRDQVKCQRSNVSTTARTAVFTSSSLALTPHRHRRAAHAVMSSTRSRLSPIATHCASPFMIRKRCTSGWPRAAIATRTLPSVTATAVGASIADPESTARGRASRQTHDVHRSIHRFVDNPHANSLHHRSVRQRAPFRDAHTRIASWTFPP